MNRLLLSFTAVGLMITAAHAQKLDDAKTALVVGQYKMAKDKIDKALVNPKEAGKPELYIAKAAIYGALTVDSAFATQVPTLIAESEAAYNKYLEMDPKQALVKDPLYSNTTIYLYQYYYNDGYKLYQKKQFAEAANFFSKTITLTKFIMKNELAKLTFDTTLYTLAGDAYQKIKDDEKAAPYFIAMANKKIGGEDYKFLYSFLMTHYFDRNLTDSFNN